jgi:hypothetical protein
MNRASSATLLFFDTSTNPKHQSRLTLACCTSDSRNPSTSFCSSSWPAARCVSSFFCWLLASATLCAHPAPRQLLCVLAQPSGSHTTVSKDVGEAAWEPGVHQLHGQYETLLLHAAHTSLAWYTVACR